MTMCSCIECVPDMPPEPEEVPTTTPRVPSAEEIWNNAVTHWTTDGSPIKSIKVDINAVLEAAAEVADRGDEPEDIAAAIRALKEDL